MKKSSASKKRPADAESPQSAETAALSEAEQRAARKRAALLSSKGGGLFSSSSVKSEPSQHKTKAAEGVGGESNTASCIGRGIALDTVIFDSVGKGGVPAKKKRIIMANDTIVSNGDISVVCSGIPCYNFMLPIKFIDTPEMAEDKKKSYGKPRELVIADEFTKARFLGIVAPSFYLDNGPGGANAIHPGMPAEIRGLHATFGNKAEQAHRLYVNAGSKPTSLKDEAYPRYELPMAMIEAAMHPNFMKWGAFAWSMTMRGFMTIQYDEPQLAEQAQACKDLWTSARDTMAARVKEMSQRAGEGVNRTNLLAHAERIAELPVLELVKSGRVFAEEEYDQFHAPLVQTGLKPGNRWPKPFWDLRTESAAECAYLPDYFSSAIVSAIDFKGNRVDIEFKMYFVFDKHKAIKFFDSIPDDSDASPILHTGTTAVCVNISKKQLAHMLGSMHVDKCDLAKEILPVAESVYWPKVFARDPADEAIDMDFPCTYAVDMAKSLREFPILPEEFVMQHLTRGSGQHINPVLGEHEKVEMPKGVSECPTFTADHYQELTFSAWADDEHLRVPSGFKREFRVLYPNVLKDVEATEELATDTKLGTAKIEELAKAENLAVPKYLHDKCLVYAILVKEPETL